MSETEQIVGSDALLQMRYLDSSVECDDQPLRAIDVSRLTKQICGELPSRPAGRYLKRAFDVVFALIALLFLAPLITCCWALVRVETKGPGLFKQRRGGFGGKVFEIYKIRTMRMETEPNIDNVHDDSRVTLIGKFLRKSSIDELPQLVNVLRGEMSIVGPRPHIVEHDVELATLNPDYVMRYTVRPGLTGLAQVQGSRGPMRSMKDKCARINLDLAYVESASLRTDLHVILKTFFVILGREKC